MNLAQDRARPSHITASIGAAQHVLCLACADLASLAAGQAEADDAARAAKAEKRRVFCVEADPQEAHRLRKLYAQSGLAVAPVVLPVPEPLPPPGLPITPLADFGAAPQATSAMAGLVEAAIRHAP